LTLPPFEPDNRRVPRAAAEIGSTANSYQIMAKLAAGGMAEIFLARGEAVAGVERYCVLKRILRDRASDVHFVRMFLDEARLAAQLQHPNIAQVYDIGKLGDSYFFTMEYVHGETVRALLHRAQGLRRKLPINCVLTIVAGTAAGLHHAHTRLGRDGRPLGIVHRDVSPSNLMVSYEGSVKVVDFGVAKAEDRMQETKSGTVKGKISYLSPEQCKGRRVDRRSDLFSLGICFWEMLTTERLFKRASDFENMNAIVTETTPPPSSRRPDVPPEIDELVLRLLAKAPEHRFQTADEVVEAVEAVASRTSSVLSASALGRFTRELFGQRPEPWLELEAQQEHGEPVTVTSEPIPRELGIPAAEEIDRQLASVVNLTSARSITESLEPVPPELPPARVVGKLGLPLAAPPPTLPQIALPTPVSAPSSSDAHTPSSGQLILPAPPELPPAVPGSGPHAAPAGTPSGSIAVPVGSRVTSSGSPGSSGSFVPPSGSQSAVRALAAYSPSERRRAAWPLYAAIISGAALLGSIAVVVMMRSSAEAIRVDTASVSRAPAPIVTPIESPPTTPAAPATTASSTETAMAEPEAASAAPADPQVGAEALKGSGGKRPSAPGSVTQPGAVPSPARRTQPARVLAGPSHNAEPHTGPQAPWDNVGTREPKDDEIARSYAAALYDKVVTLCGAGPVNAEHAPKCFLAACRTRNDTKAKKLITAVPVSQREQLTANCKQLGVDITVRKKPIDKPADDCEADPMACQH
jgi:serine/threonine protein kinase